MAYSLETSSVKTIVPGAEVSGFCDVVARQKINEVSGEVPKLSAGEGIDISTVDGETVITNNISAGENISIVYDMESNTYRIDGNAAGHTYTGVAPIQVNNSTDEISITGESLSAGPGIDMFSSGGYVVISAGGADLTNYYTKTETSSKNEIYNALLTAGKTYTGIAPVVVNNNDNTIAVTNYDLSAGPNMDIFQSGGYVVFSSRSDNPFPITGTNGTTGFTANMDCSSFAVSTGAGPAGAYTKQTVRGIQYEAYPSTDVSASWYNIINAANSVNITCSAVKLTTAASENWFYTSSLPNLNEITFIAPSYGPYQTYSALIDDGETTFVAEVDSGCCMKVVRNWNDDRNKDCWCGLNQETYFYIG